MIQVIDFIDVYLCSEAGSARGMHGGGTVYIYSKAREFFEISVAGAAHNAPLQGHWGVLAGG